MAESLNDTIAGLLGCVCDALETAERPTCECYRTVGAPVIGPNNCCECEATGTTGEATAHFEQMYDADPTTLEQVNRIHPCRSSTTVADVTVVVTRCYPRIDEQGQMPAPVDVDAAAELMHADVCTVWKALTCCTELRMAIRSVAVDAMPEAGCAVIAARVSVEVAC